MTDLELAILLCPKSFFDGERDREFWIGRARIARLALERESFGFVQRLRRHVALRLRGRRTKPGPGVLPGQEWKVRLHPLPEGASRPLASVIGAAVAGALRDCLHVHPIHNLTRAQKGMLIGSTRKRAVNQLVCKEGVTRIRLALEGTL